MYRLFLLLGTLHPDQNESTTADEASTLDKGKGAAGDSLHDRVRIMDGIRRTYHVNVNI
jgi:hypothetical protein